MAVHESPRTTKLYDRTADVITLDEVERIVFVLRPAQYRLVCLDLTLLWPVAG
jgi:hypothetical protein